MKANSRTPQQEPEFKTRQKNMYLGCTKTDILNEKG